jgi:Tol biopolymer transport system component
MTGDRKAWRFLKTSPFAVRDGQFSPNGRWVAYMWNESARPEIYVRPFVDPASGPSTGGGERQVSTGGGIFPRWRSDGKELYYLGPEGQMMAVPITTTGATLEPGRPVPLFQTHIYGGGTDNQQFFQYDVARDGRFLINTVLDDITMPITLVQNWNPDLRK